MNEAAEILSKAYPGRTSLLLLPVCGPEEGHRHNGEACTRPGKRPVAGKGWNATAVNRYRNGANPEAHIAAISSHVVSGGNVGWAIPPGIAVLDADSFKADDWLNRYLPNGHPYQKTAKGGHHVLRIPATVCGLRAKTGVEIGDGVKADLRMGERSQVVVAPSVHVSGASYEWIHPLPADLEQIPEIPAELAQRIVRELAKPRAAPAASVVWRASQFA